MKHQVFIAILLAGGLFAVLVATPQSDDGPAAPAAQSDALASVIAAHTEQTRRIDEQLEQDVGNGIWIGMGRTELDLAASLLEQGLPSQAVRSALFARWFLTVPTEIPDLGAPRADARTVLASEDLQQRIDATAATIDVLRAGVDAEGLHLLVLAQQYHAKAEEDLETLGSVPGPDATDAEFRDSAIQALMVRADLDLVDAFLSEAARRPGSLPGSVPLLDDVVTLARLESRALAEAPGAEDPLSTYHLATERYPRYMDRMLERGWEEGALHMAMETLLHARLEQATRDGVPVTPQQAKEAAAGVEAGKDPFARVTWQRVQSLLQGDDDRSRHLLVLLADLDPLYDRLHQQLLDPTTRE